MSKDLCFKWELPDLRFPEDCLTILGLEGSVFVAVPMRLPRIGPFIRSNSRLLQCLCEHHLIEESGGGSLHNTLVIGEIIFEVIPKLSGLDR